MNIFNRIGIGTKVLIGIFIALLFMLLVSGVAIYRLEQINQEFKNVTDNLADEQQLALDMSSRFFQLRFYASRYISFQLENDQKQYSQSVTDFRKTLERADASISEQNRRTFLSNVKSNFENYTTAYDQVYQILNQRQNSLNNTLDAQGPYIHRRLDELSQELAKTNNSQALLEVMRANGLVNLMRLDVFKYLVEGNAEQAQEFTNHSKEVQDEFKKLEGEIEDPALKQILTDSETALGLYTLGFQSIKDGYDRQTDIIKNKLDFYGSEGMVNASDIVRSVNQEFNEKAQTTNSMVLFTSSLIGILTISAIILGVIMGLLISRSITVPLKKLVNDANAVADGNFDQVDQEKNSRQHTRRQDEIGEISRAFERMIHGYLQPMAEKAREIAAGNLTVNAQPTSEQDILGKAFCQMVSSLRQLTLQMRQATANITASTSQITASVSEQATTATQQAAAVAETTSTVEEVRQTAEQTSERTQTVSDMTRNSLVLAERGLQSVKKTEEGMISLKEQVRTIAETILALSEQTQQIGDIIATVDDIADQSNLLALNAAMEAARAGEAGRGFAVVAGEVRNLAEQSRQATGQVSSILGEIQKAANTAVMVTEQGTKRAEASVELVQSTGEMIHNIQQHTEQVSMAAQQIAASTRQQLAGMDQITHAMENINLSASQSQTGLRQVEQACQNLNNLSDQLSSLIRQYRVA